jgi:multisubunit Na+/H+ antiporter MnhG subunit
VLPPALVQALHGDILLAPKAMLAALFSLVTTTVSSHMAAHMAFVRDRNARPEAEREQG